MSEKPLAAAHRRVGHAGHAVERRMLGLADEVPDPEAMRIRAREPSAHGDGRLAKADALEDADDVSTAGARLECPTVG
ncbi:hypothetical protein [Geodermatophilus dictyosporus]|uniref:hypothetical protein n=1 Tax=Geodermatophilus dictyosporus TaxID=1523247 RepID=UPI0010AB0A77|nr:hypothetical protein [Geodermatophilus dictyosporus]